MNWKTVMLAALLYNLLSFPVVYSCTGTESNDLSDLSRIDLKPSVVLVTDFIQPLGKPISLAVDDVAIPKDTDKLCCSSDRNNPIYSQEKEKRRRKRRITSSVLRRIKRFPIHLDPLYQYRYLTRSGQCPISKDGMPEFYCPTPDKHGNWRCIDDFQLCDGVRHCPNSEDELPVSCLFYRVVETHLHSVSQRLNSDNDGRQRSPR